MPDKLDRCVQKVKKQGYTDSQAWAICTTSLCYRRKNGKWVKDTNWCKKFKKKVKKKLLLLMLLLEYLE